MYACKKATVGNRDPGNTCPTSPPRSFPRVVASNPLRSVACRRRGTPVGDGATPFPSLYERRPRWHETRIRRGCILTPSSSFLALFPLASSLPYRSRKPVIHLDASCQENIRYNGWYARPMIYVYVNICCRFRRNQRNRKVSLTTSLTTRFNMKHGIISLYPRFPTPSLHIVSYLLYLRLFPCYLNFSVS